MIRTEPGSITEGGTPSKRPRPRPTSRPVVIESDDEDEEDAGAAKSSQDTRGDEPASKKRKGKVVVEMGGRQAKVRKLVVEIGRARETLDELAEALERLENAAKEL